MEAALLHGGGKGVGPSTWDLFVEELKKVSYIAAPMVVVTVSQILPRIVSMMMVGHLGELALSGVAVATSLTNVTGLSLLFGMASALETLCGQAFGAEQYKKLGVYNNASIICLLLVCLPLSFLWIFMENLLIFLGQDPSISHEAGRYAISLIPSLFSYAILQSLIRYLQTQSLIVPMVWSSVAALFFHIPVCWALVFKAELGTVGAAMAISLSCWFNVVLLLVYVKYSSTCKETRAPFDKDVLLRMREFFRFAVPSAVMVCLEWWSFEVLVLLSGLLPNPQLETSVLSICPIPFPFAYTQAMVWVRLPFPVRLPSPVRLLFPADLAAEAAPHHLHSLMIGSLHYFIPYSVGAAASTRVANELGAGCPERAQASVYAASFLSIIEAILACILLLGLGSSVGYAFSNEKEVVDYLQELTPFVCLLLAMDCIQAVLSGVARGCGRQHLGAYVNLGAYYIVGLPAAVALGFGFRLRGKGLWLGVNMGSIVQSTLLAVVTCSTNWRNQASMARQRIFEGTLALDPEKALA